MGVYLWNMDISELFLRDQFCFPGRWIDVECCIVTRQERLHLSHDSVASTQTHQPFGFRANTEFTGLLAYLKSNILLVIGTLHNFSYMLLGLPYWFKLVQGKTFTNERNFG